MNPANDADLLGFVRLVMRFGDSVQNVIVDTNHLVNSESVLDGLAIQACTDRHSVRETCTLP